MSFDTLHYFISYHVNVNAHTVPQWQWQWHYHCTSYQIIDFQLLSILHNLTLTSDNREGTWPQEVHNAFRTCLSKGSRPWFWCRWDKMSSKKRRIYHKKWYTIDDTTGFIGYTNKNIYDICYIVKYLNNKRLKNDCLWFDICLWFTWWEKSNHIMSSLIIA